MLTLYPVVLKGLNSDVLGIGIAIVVILNSFVLHPLQQSVEFWTKNRLHRIVD
jgi:hypothetical protein